MKSDLITCYREIGNAQGTVKLTQLIDSETGKPINKELIIFFGEECWDNCEHNFDFLKNLKNYKEELQEDCRVQKLDYKETKDFLKQAYKFYKKYWK